MVNYNDGKINEDMVKDGDNVLKNFKAYCKENKLNFEKLKSYMSNYDKKDRWAKRIETNLLITSDFVSQKV